METVFLVVLSLCFGSFVNALVWRLKNKRDFVSERSECVHCHHILAWYDLIPLISWTILKGKCRYCHKKIDDSPLTELAVAVVFVISYIWWPLGFTIAGCVLFALWLTALVILVALFIYDMRWSLLPNVLVFPLIAIGVAWVVVYYMFVAFTPPLSAFIEILYSLASVAGLYGAIYVVSRGQWIGFGDVKLGVFMGLVLGWRGGLFAVILANLMAFLVVVPGMLSGKMTRKSRVPFGPFLILATFVALLFGDQLIRAYISFVFNPIV